MGSCCSGSAAAEINKTAVDLSHFDLLKVVGKGGFGKVNAVEHRLTGQLYALKTIEKALLLKNDSNRSTVWMERDVMARFRSHFLVHLKYAFQDKSFLYLVMNFMKGGDLRFHLDNHGPLSEDHTRFYMAEMLLGLQEMNSLGIVYRDLKPENVLLDEGGHLRISDFGLCSQLKAERGWVTYGESGTPGYLAPEVLQKMKYNTSQDVWSFGIVLFEFLHNHLPFDVNNREDVISGDFRVKSSLSPEVRDLLKGLLTKDPTKRLGMGPTKWEEVKSHPWFRSIDWKLADELRLTPPFQPDPDVANCSSVFDLEDQLLYVHKDVQFSAADQAKFNGFEYHTQITPEEITAMLKAKKEGKTPDGTSSMKGAPTPSNRRDGPGGDKNMNNTGNPPGKVKVMLKDNAGTSPAGTAAPNGHTNNIQPTTTGPNGPAAGVAAGTVRAGTTANGTDVKHHHHHHQHQHQNGGGGGAVPAGQNHKTNDPTSNATITVPSSSSHHHHNHHHPHHHHQPNGVVQPNAGDGASALPAAAGGSSSKVAPIVAASASHTNLPAIAGVSTSAVVSESTPSPSTQTLIAKSGIPGGGKSSLPGGGGPLFVHTVQVDPNAGSQQETPNSSVPVVRAVNGIPEKQPVVTDEKRIPFSTTSNALPAPVPEQVTASGETTSTSVTTATTATATATANPAGAGDPFAVNGNPNASLPQPPAPAVSGAASNSATLQPLPRPDANANANANVPTTQA